MPTKTRIYLLAFAVWLSTIAGASAQSPPGKSTYLSSGTGQFALAISTNTQLTVPALTSCAYITVEGSSVRRTSDGTSASTRDH